MWWIIGALVIIIVLAIFLSGSSSSQKTTQSGQISNSITHSNFNQKLNKLSTLQDNQDQKAHLDQSAEEVSKTIRTYKKNKRKVIPTVNNQKIIIETEWADDLNKLIDVTEVIYTNAQMNATHRLEKARFHYYAKLHYRSLVAADLLTFKMREIEGEQKKVRQIISQLKDRSNPLKVSQSNLNTLTQLKDQMYSIHTFLKQRRDYLNNQTHNLKFKIKNECGQRGEEWFLERQANARK